VRTATLVGILAAVILGLFGCAGGPPSDRSHVRVAVSAYFSNAPLHLALVNGHFSDQGLDVEFVALESAARAVPLLLSGQIDVLPSSFTPAMLHAIAAGERVRFVADKGWVDPEGCSLAVLASRPGVFEGRSGRPDDPRVRISIPLEQVLLRFVERALEERGLSLEDETFETFNLPSAAEMIAFGEGTLDAALVNEPYVGVAESEYGLEVLAEVKDVIPGAQLSALAYGPRLLDRDVDVGRRFMVAYLQAVREFNQGKTAENLAAFSEFTGLAEDVLARMCWVSIRNDGVANLSRLAEFVGWYRSRGWLDRAPDLDEVWDPSFVEYAAREMSGAADATETEPE